MSEANEAHTAGPWVQADSNPFLVFQDSQGVINTNKPVAQFKYAKDARLATCVHDLLAACEEMESLLRVENPAHHGNPKAHAAACKKNRVRMQAAIKAAREGK